MNSLGEGFERSRSGDSPGSILNFEADSSNFLGCSEVGGNHLSYAARPLSKSKSDCGMGVLPAPHSRPQPPDAEFARDRPAH
jgi:hypothetical protein